MPQSDGKLLTPNQVIKMLQVSQSWLYKKCQAGIIPHIRIGGIIRFREEELNKWLSDHGIKGCLKV